MTRSDDETTNSDADLSTISSEIAGLREELVEIEKVANDQSEVRRVQRAHLIVAIGVVSAFATLYSAPQGGISIASFWSSNEPIYPLLVHSCLFLVYIPIHLYTITLWSLSSETWADQLHEFFLPFSNLILLCGSLPLILFVILDLNLSYRWVKLNAVTYIIAEAIVLYYPAIKHAEAFKETMSEIQTDSKSRRIRVSTRPSGDSPRVRVKNNSDEKIAGENIELRIETPESIEIENVVHATKSGSGYILHDDIDADDFARIPIKIDPLPTAKYDDYRGENVTVDILFNGEKASTEQFKL